MLCAAVDHRLPHAMQLAVPRISRTSLGLPLSHSHLQQAEGAQQPVVLRLLTCVHHAQIKSDQNIAFNEKPRMKCREITAAAVEALRSGKYRHVRLNFPNPDMVGHTGDFEATVEGCTAVDECVKVSCTTLLRTMR